MASPHSGTCWCCNFFKKLLHASLTVQSVFCRFLKYLASCGASLKEDCHEFTPLHINLGAPWSQQVHDDFKKHDHEAEIVEHSHTGWEHPPGLGTFALQDMFHLCITIRSWLQAEDLHSVVSLFYSHDIMHACNKLYATGGLQDACIS